MKNAIYFVSLLCGVIGFFVVTALAIEFYAGPWYASNAGYDVWGISHIVPFLGFLWFLWAALGKYVMSMYPERKPPFYRNWRCVFVVVCTLSPIVLNKLSMLAGQFGAVGVSDFLYSTRYAMFLAGFIAYFGNELINRYFRVDEP